MCAIYCTYHRLSIWLPTRYWRGIETLAKTLIKRLHKKVLDLFCTNLRQSHQLSHQNQDKLTSTFTVMRCSCFCNFRSYLPDPARLSCTQPLMLKTPPDPLPDLRNPHTSGQALCNGCWTRSGQPFTSGPSPGPSVGLPELDKLIGHSGWAMWRAWAYQFSVFIQPCQHVDWWKRSFPLHNAQMAHFMGHTTRTGERRLYGLPCQWNQMVRYSLTGMVKRPLRTWLNPDELAPPWDRLIPLWWECLHGCDLALRISTGQVSGLINSQAPCPPVLRKLLMLSQ